MIRELVHNGMVHDGFGCRFRANALSYGDWLQFADPVGWKVASITQKVGAWFAVLENDFAFPTGMPKGQSRKLVGKTITGTRWQDEDGPLGPVMTVSFSNGQTVDLHGSEM